ncbi:MAG: hypothetical protein ABJB74_16935 [Gemmatimonas sp.]
MRRTVLLVASLMMLVFPQGLRAQLAAQIAPGDRVRLSAKSLGTANRIGILTKVDNERLYLLDPGVNGAAWEIQVDKLDQIDVRRPNAGNHTHRGALIGMLTGFVGVGVIGYVASSCNGCEYDHAAALLAGPAGGIGALVGGLVGHSQTAEGWQRVSKLPVKVGFTPMTRRSFRLSGSIAF